MINEKQCPCDSGLNFLECCTNFISGDSVPLTAEALMRSRYSAYVLGNADYIVETTHPKKRTILLEKSVTNWIEEASFQKLEIINTGMGQEKDKAGKVEFKAFYTSNDTKTTHHELSKFKKYDGKWYFFDGEVF